MTRQKNRRVMSLLLAAALILPAAACDSGGDWDPHDFDREECEARLLGMMFDTAADAAETLPDGYDWRRIGPVSVLRDPHGWAVEVSVKAYYGEASEMMRREYFVGQDCEILDMRDL